MFSLEVDTTQDISVKDQCSFVFRYVYEGKVYERLIAVVACHDSSGQGFFNIFKEVLEKNNILTSSCVADSTDGAANMQGKYNGFATKLQIQNTEHIHIWCNGHILNLVLSDVFKGNLKASTLFSLINSVATFFRESYKRMDIWCSISNDEKKRRLGIIGQTRWWSKEKELEKIFGDSPLYLDILESLFDISQNSDIGPDIRSTADNLKEQFLKYENIFLSQVFLKIFSITGPLSRYLQTRGLDLLKANAMIETAITELKKIQRNFEAFEKSTQTFLTYANSEMAKRDIHFDIEEEFPVIRVRKIKKFFDEKGSDEAVNTPKEKFKIETFNIIMDIAITSMENRFSRNINLCADMAIFNPINFSEIKANGIPENSLQVILKKILPFKKDAELLQIKEELESFVINWDFYKKTLNESFQKDMREQGEDNIETTDEDSDVVSSDSEIFTCKNDENPNNLCRNCVHCCYLAIIKYNMYQNAYPCLSIAYQYILTLPVTQVSCERSFSILKHIKTRLRNSLSDEHLESFMIMNIEKDLLCAIDNEEVINELSGASSLLNRLLNF